MSQRTLTESNTKLIGALVSVVGTVAITKYNNRLTTLTNLVQLKRYMLMPVRIAGVYYDHLWIHSCDEIDHFKNGDKVSFTATMNTYRSDGKRRIAIKFPYGNVLPIKPIFYQINIPTNYLWPIGYRPIYPPLSFYDNPFCQARLLLEEPRKVLKFSDMVSWDIYGSPKLISSYG